jgi:hypothetical protein
VRSIVFLGLLAAGLASSACAYYRVEDRNGPVATFRFDYALGLSQYSIVGENACEKGARLAKFGTFDSSIKNVKVASGKPVRIKARTYFHGRLNSEPNWCESVAEFTPQSDRTYRMRHYQPEDRQCVLKLEDENDGATPPDLVIQDSLPCPPITASW